MNKRPIAVVVAVIGLAGSCGPGLEPPSPASTVGTDSNPRPGMTSGAVAGASASAAGRGTLNAGAGGAAGSQAGVGGGAAADAGIDDDAGK